MRSQDLSDDEIVRRGAEIYEKIKALVEPIHDGADVAICVEDGDYEVAETISDADSRLRARHLDADFFYGRVGGDHAVRWSSGYSGVATGKP